MNDQKTRIDRQWYDAIPKGWGNPKGMRWSPAAEKKAQERGDREMHSGEREMLYDVLDGDENIRSLVGGTYRAQGSTGMSRGVAIATDRRVVFVDKGVFGSTEVSEGVFKGVTSNNLSC